MRIWFLTHRVPFAPNRGDRIRAYHILRFLRERAEVDLFSLAHDPTELTEGQLLQGTSGSSFCARVPLWRNRVRAALSLWSDAPLTEVLLDAPTLRRQIASRFSTHRPDVVLAFCSSMAVYAMESPLNDVPMVLDMVDIDSEKWRALAESTKGPKGLIFRREARCLRVLERRAMDTAIVTTAVNEREVSALRQINPNVDVVAVPNGISFESFARRSKLEESASVVFCGVLDYAPNEEAALRLVQRIWPLVIRQRPDARLLLVGMNPTVRLRSTAMGQSTILITGAVSDVRPYLWQAALAAVPLSVARGVQNKVLEAIAAGLPTVVSSVVAEGLPPAVEPGIAIAGSDEEFARAILRWLGLPPDKRHELTAQCDLSSLSWDRQLEPLWRAVLMASGRADRLAG